MKIQTMKKYAKSTIVASLLVAIPIVKAEIKSVLGYNSIENAIVVSTVGNGNIRTRTWADAGIAGNNFKAHVVGLNEITNLNNNTYFGNNRLLVGKKNSPVELVAIGTTTNKGLVDKMFGIRERAVLKKIGANYGFTEFSANKDGTNNTIFYGRSISPKITLELFNSSTLPYKGKTRHYSEVQLNVDLNKHCAVFGRAELLNHKTNGSTYLVGIMMK